MAQTDLTRREFLIIGGSLAAGSLVGSRAAAQPSPRGAVEPRVIYRLSLRRRRGSKAGKLHNANLRFATESAADANRAHPGDNSRIVSIVVSEDEFDRLFSSRNGSVADLRSLGGPVLVGDCNRNGQVTVDEMVHGVNIALGKAPVSGCTPFDRVADGRVNVDELIKGVGNVLR
jgi:hypothetical protein